jgi:hypothetical protein
MAFPSENSIDLVPAVAYAGQIAEPAAPRFCRSGSVEGAGVTAGVALKRGTDPDVQVKAFASTDVVTPQNFAGLAVLSTSRSFDEINTDLDANSALDVMRLGTIYLSFSGTVIAGQSVKMKMSDLTFEGVSAGADPGAGYCVLPGVRVAQDRTGAGVAIVEINIMGASQDAAGAGGAAIRVANIPVGPVARASIGTDAASTAGSIYFADLVLDAPMTATGLAMLNGTTAVGTDSQIFALWDEAGNVLRTTALAGVLAATADVFQEIAFTSPIALGPGLYWIGFQVNGTTTPHQTIAASTYLNSTGSVAGVFGTIPAITPTTTTTANVGPVGYLYT